MKINRIVQSSKKYIYATAAAAALAGLTSCTVLKSQLNADKFETSKEQVIDDWQKQENKIKAFFVELLAGCAVVGISILGAWENKPPKK